MANLSQSESRRLYSWWWDSHIPKNSKWIQDNLADMDSKVKTMIKLIEADADSFARRADMYFKKRPELMKLVEELYRAYRALAERYDHTTVELRRAHKVMVEAFPNQIPFGMIEDSASSSSEPYTEDFQKGGATSERSLSQVNNLCGTSDSHEADSEVESLKETLLELQTEKEALNLQYQLTLTKLSRFEKELNDAQKDVRGFDERACKAEIEIKILKESLAKLEVERDTWLLQYNQSMDKIADLEASVSHEQEYAKGLTDKASEAEREAMSLKQELSRLQSEKETDLIRYNKCLELISVLEKKIRDAEESIEIFRDQSEQAENEIKALKQELLKLNEVNEDLSVRYQQCLETISNLEREVSHAQDNAKRMSSEVLAGAAKIKTVEEQCALLESFNQTLKVEADNLLDKMSVKDQELVQKENEIEKLQALMQEEQLRFSELGASLRNLESLHSQSQEEQKVLTLELQSRIQMLSELEMRNHKLEGDISSVEEENRNLSEVNNTSMISFEIQKNEISCLKKMKEKLEEEVAKQMNQSSALQVEIHYVKSNIDNMKKRFQNLIDQVRLTGFDPQSLSYSVKKLQDENSKLIELCTNQRDEKNAVAGKLSEMDSILKRNADLEKFLLESNTKLDGSREKAKDLQERCESLQGEKSELSAERANFFSQLQIMTANMQKLLEKNSLLESSLSVANIELISLRDKSKYFEDFVLMLKNDKYELMKERESLVSQLYKVEEKLGILEKKYTELEVKYADSLSDNKLKNHQVEELQVSLAAEKQESANYKRSTESRLADLQKNVSYLREECRSRKREYEEELDRVVNKQVEIFILQKLIEDLEQKNFSLLIECQKHVEASEFSEKLISELENENLEQQMEAEIFLDEIDSLRGVIYQVIKALQVEAHCKNSEQKIAKDQPSVSLVLGEIDGLKCSLSSAEYEMQRLVVENSVLLSLLGQFQSDGLLLESEKNTVEKDLKTVVHQCGMLEKDKQELLETNRLLKSKLIKREQQEQELRAELQTEHLKFESLHKSYMVLQQDYSSTLNDNKSLLLKFSELKDGMCVVEEDNDAILQEAVALSNMCEVYKSFGSGMAVEVESFVEAMRRLQEISTGLRHKVETLEERLKGKEEESQGLKEMLEMLHEGIEEDNFLNGLLDHQVYSVDKILERREMEILEAEHVLKATHTANEELHREVEELRKDCEKSRQMRGNLERQISELSDVTGKQEEEITKLNTMNENLESEVDFLHEEIQRQQVREEYLSFELQEKSNEIELWDAEATSFYFDFHISAVRELILENKVNELTGVCKNLNDEVVTKTTKINQMKETIGFLESQVTELKSKLSAYDPVITSLAGDVKSSLDKSTQALTKFPATAYQQREGDNLEEAVCQENEESGSTTSACNGIVILKETKPRNKEKGRLSRKITRSASHKSRGRMKIENIQLDDKFSGESKQTRSRSRMTEVKNGLSMKENPHDLVTDSQICGRSQGTSRRSNEMFEFWDESDESETSINFLINCNEPQRPLNSRLRRLSRNPSIESDKAVGVVDKAELSRNNDDKAKIMERLLSDSRRLSSLRISLTDLKSKLEMNEKQGRFSNADLVIVKRQLKEMEESVLQLENTNEILSKEIEETGDARDIYRKVVVEKSKNGSEKIEQLQNKLQNIEQAVLKLEDGTKSKGSKMLSETRTVILLRDIIHKSGKRTARKKKNRFCGCIRSSTNEE
ncbi:PREDICTED: protein NETWORKED 1B-like isoform X1 [Camelina sativa]|uniref:Protein NETWORKED 1B-like isoform X1 n=1 Tax=Camelina sativa TaxID=90675 RepID=A0ABM0UFH9_CAMSA|nr:PREDICTED: protein NETWORKED 1B-like isoform X1 [Camelina sativa]XP_010440395.1 PREDICTED: protein NETWORKED 1B-like isoform X2 [Camelina sativa]XP_010440396.1 PREDICTED: protein NETWORKED 1B-like isoform X1 [Camelina sativa]XP_010440397.1 PREDICTED: protein NETWORKED 1B-like isoform X1 [Camelina sativa]XP_010440398.1 PREDICTED: protein NETWORKED 1B-like isoform X1 [Camelina sativa]XP_010440399.1 PREDICTED: protein NETWORKED 1B-like isoform X1 [Camelina sativa]